MLIKNGHIATALMVDGLLKRPQYILSVWTRPVFSTLRIKEYPNYFFTTFLLAGPFYTKSSGEQFISFTIITFSSLNLDIYTKCLFSQKKVWYCWKYRLKRKHDTAYIFHFYIITALTIPLFFFYFNKQLIDFCILRLDEKEKTQF